MDWYSWLSKSTLDPFLAREYALLFANNELEEEDIAYFDHGFLQSMGIAIAKHRLEILKLAKCYGRAAPASPLPVAKLVAVIRRSKNCLAKYLQAMAARSNSSAAAVLVVPKTSYGDRWMGAVLRRKTKLALLKQGRLMITDRGMSIARPPLRSLSASPMVASFCHENSNVADGDGDGDVGYWETADGAMSWDSMFQNLKPT